MCSVPPKNGEGGIRTRGTLMSTLVFETSSISRSDTSPTAELFPTHLFCFCPPSVSEYWAIQDLNL